MFDLDAFHLARIQFAFTVSFHIIFPAITIGLASYLAVLEGMWLKTKKPVVAFAVPLLVKNLCR
ncbi:Bacterial Cytochrome Ubiquinol Oxidase [Atlantibacter hermannii]|nr:Bacterial Cytochrome Ubiquinol Oxidase [Atlantibacter hermannii]